MKLNQWLRCAAGVLVASALAAACGEGGSGSSSASNGGADGAAGDGAAGASAIRGGASACGCEASDTCCDAQCVDLESDVENCGECGGACEPARAVPACVDGACGIEHCLEGFVDCNGRPADGCEVEDTGLPGRPRLLAPAVGAYTGSVFADSSLKPGLSWTAATEGSCGEVSYQVQLDDSCTPGDTLSCEFESAEVDEAGITELSWRPSAPLAASTEVPVGTQYHWRVRACEAGERCSDWSDARYLNVGRLRDDFNADGFSDVFANSQDGDSALHIHLIPGREPAASGQQEEPQRPPVNLPATTDSFGSARYLGDVNGDGFADGIRSTSTGAELLLGAADLTEVVQSSLPGGFVGTHGVAGIGDWNGDGYADFAMSDSVLADTPAGVVHVYSGNAEAVFESPLDITPPAGTTAGSFGNSLEGGFDFDGDGYTDLFILDGDDGRLHFVNGGKEPDTKVSASLTTNGACPYHTRPTVTHAGDMNADGYADLAVHCALELMVFAGARTPELTPIWTHSLSAAAQTLGHDVIGGYDLGSDGFSDLVVIGDSTSGTNLFVLPGAAALASAGAPLPFTGKLDEKGLMRSDMGLTAGDYDGDGRADLVVQVFSTGELRLFSGGRTISGGSCVSNPSAAEKFGDWCRAAVRTIEGRYETQYNPDYQIGGSFGFVLGR